MKVTHEMIGAAHDICLKKGDFVLSADLLERIYLAMDALANHAETSGSLSSTTAAEPFRYRYVVNGTHELYSHIEPPDDAYDEGTLIPLYRTTPSTTAAERRVPDYDDIPEELMDAMCDAFEAADCPGDRGRGNLEYKVLAALKVWIKEQS